MRVAASLSMRRFGVPPAARWRAPRRHYRDVIASFRSDHGVLRRIDAVTLARDAAAVPFGAQPRP